MSSPDFNVQEFRERLMKWAADHPEEVDNWRPIFKWTHSYFQKNKHAFNRRKEAVAESTSRLIEWAFLRDEPIQEERVVKFFKHNFGWNVDWQEEQSDLRWERGERVEIDLSNCDDGIIRSVIKDYDGEEGVVKATEEQDATLKSDRGQYGDIVVKLDNGKEFTVPNGQMTKESGLLSPRAEEFGEGENKVEMVYVSASHLQDLPVPDSRKEAVEEYIRKGEEQGEWRHVSYYTGPAYNLKETKEGHVVFTIEARQRPYPVTVNPVKGNLLYLGQLGARPSGLENEIARLKQKHDIDTVEDVGPGTY